MEENKYIFRAVNPRSDEDMKKYVELLKGLSMFLNNNKNFDENTVKWKKYHFGAIEYIEPEEFENKPLPNLQEHADEFAFICEKDDEFVGGIEVASYHVVDHKRPNDDIGIISEIFVKNEYRGQSAISLKLLQMGVQKLMESGKFRAICNVQEDNKFRYLHFAMADGNVIHKDKCKRKNGTETIDYTLMIDLKKLHDDITKGKLARRIGKYHMEMLKSEQQIITI